MKNFYCYKCKKQMPFLEEYEWQQISPLLGDALKSMKDYLKINNCDIQTAKENFKSEATIMFENITGIPNIDYWTVLHHRLKDWGQTCLKCGYLLRTNKAKLCANCGWEKE